MTDTAQDIYETLKAPFIDTFFRDGGGGMQLEYISGEQAVTRLNDGAGVNNWDWEILHEEVDYANDQVWVKGKFTLRFPDGTTSFRMQFGSNEIKRQNDVVDGERYSKFPDWKKAQFTRLENGSYRGPRHGKIIDLGFDLKGASTDALKKAASLAGVGLYLSAKSGNGNGQQRSTPPPQRPSQSQGQQQQSTAQNQGNATAPVSGDTEALHCEECGEMLTETRFKDGTSWAPAQLATFGRRKHSRILCMTHYREENATKRRAEETLQTVPF